MAFLPGQDTLFVLAQSAKGGTRRGLVATAGTLAGLFLVHLPAAAFGFSALLLKSDVLFSGLKYAGAAYLLYLGIQSFRKQPPGASDSPRPQRLGSPFCSRLRDERPQSKNCDLHPGFLSTIHRARARLRCAAGIPTRHDLGICRACRVDAGGKRGRRIRATSPAQRVGHADRAVRHGHAVCRPWFTRGAHQRIRSLVRAGS